MDKVLIVEDDPDVRAALTRALSFEGYGVDTATDGGKALAMVDEEEPDAIVLDVMMPFVDGLETARMLRSHGYTTPILMLTARGEVGDRVDGLDAGADDFLCKPWEIAELMARVRVGIRLRRLQDELLKAEHQAALLEMATTLGHEINNPLTALFGHMELIMQYVARGDSARTDHHLRQAGNVAGRIADVAQRLILLSEPKTKKYLDDLRMLDLD